MSLSCPWGSYCSCTGVFQDPLRAQKLDRGDPRGLTDARSADGAGWGPEDNTTFSASPGVAPEDAVLLLDEMPTQDNVLPPLCIFSAHSVEEPWQHSGRAPNTPTLPGSLLRAAPRDAQLGFHVSFLVLFLNTKVYVLWEYGDVRVGERPPVQPSCGEIQMAPGALQKKRCGPHRAAIQLSSYGTVRGSGDRGPTLPKSLDPG